MKYTIQTKNLTKEFKNQNVLKDVNINVESGKIYGLIGKNGAGKTTLMKLLLGLLEPTSGSIQLFNSKIESYIGLQLVFLNKTILEMTGKIHIGKINIFER